MSDSEYNKRLAETRREWDEAAEQFDREPDHGLRDLEVRNAWKELLRSSIPSLGSVLDIGCGTGSISIVLAELGHEVTGIDLSPRMIDRAREKAQQAGFSIEFHVMDAAFPQFPAEQFNAVVCRHLLWALPEPASVLERWTKLLKSGGRLFLIEGFWHTGSGLHASQAIEALPPTLELLSVQNLSDRPVLWGKPVSDERYAIIAQRKV